MNMRAVYSKYNRALLIPCFTFTILSVGCTEFLKIDPPASRVVSETVFLNETTAEGALVGLYQQAFADFAGSSTGSVSVYAGMSADELVFINAASYSQQDREEINQNNISATNASMISLWTGLYGTIYSANAILEHTIDNTSLTPTMMNRCRGEAAFIRAFCYFYLCNLFGEVPLVTSTDYRKNAQLPLSTIDQAYDRIEEDIAVAMELLGSDYPSDNRLRVNKWVATALMARVQLYRENWKQAAELSSAVIAQTQAYNLEKLDEVFLAESQEALWQRASHLANTNTSEANLFITNDEHFLSHEVLKGFSENDLRRRYWVLLKHPDKELFVPYKYKSTTGTNTEEHSIIFRLAEQYLIKAEALTRLGQLDEAVNSLNPIRVRAGLRPIAEIAGITQDDLLDAVMSERRRELFSEWGHRWFDLKRTGEAAEILSSVKPEFTASDEWYPIPESEHLKNPNLKK